MLIAALKIVYYCLKEARHWIITVCRFVFFSVAYLQYKSATQECSIEILHTGPNKYYISWA